MAEYGSRFINATGQVLIDSTYSNMGMRQKGSGNTGQSLVQTVAFANGNPVLAVSGNGLLRISQGQRSGNITTFTIRSFEPNTAFEWWCFDDVAYAERYNSTHGMIVRNKNTGAVVFDSRCKYMRVLEFLAGQAPNATTQLQPPFVSRSYGVGKVAAVQCQFSYYSDAVQISPPPRPLFAIIVWDAFMKPTNGNFEAAYRVEMQYDTTNVPPAMYSPNYAYLLIDVSGL